MTIKDSISIAILNALKNKFSYEIDIETINKILEVPKEKKNGDFSFPCFNLSRFLKKSPLEIANTIKEYIENEIIDANENDNSLNDQKLKNETKKIIEKIDVINGFLNFYVCKDAMVRETIEKFAKQKEDYGKSNIGNGKEILIESSSPNIAKEFHIGHLKTTIIGKALYNLYSFLGYKTIRLNHIGDYGTQFAKLIVGYQKWGSEYDFSENPIEKLTDIYIRINTLCDEDENVLEECRSTFKKLEDGDEYCVNLWTKIKDLSMEEFNKIYDLLDVKFDEIDGEAFYSDKMDEVVDILEKSGKLTESNRAKIVDLEDQGIKTPCIILKSNGSSIYATRDLAAILYRARKYDYDKSLYVVGNEQELYFKQIFAVAKYLGLSEKHLNGLEHVGYGMIRLPEGKMSTRKGNFVKVSGLLNDAISKVSEILKDRNIENKDEVSKIVGIGAVIFDDLKESRIKTQVFDLNTALNFNGETGPYLQYQIVRTKSILKKANFVPDENIDFSALTDESSIEIIKLISNFEETLVLASNKNEPSIIARYALDLAESYSSFYNDHKVITNDAEISKARLYLTYMTNVTLSNAITILGLKIPDEM